MSNATGLRDTPIRLYERTNSGTDGFVRAVFSFTAWWWGRLDESSAGVRAAQEKVQQKLDAVATFSDEAIVPLAGIAKDDTTGLYWWIRGINPVRQTRSQIVGLERITEEQVATFTIYEGDSVLDGVHVVEPT